MGIGAWLTAPGLPWVAAISGLNPRWRSDWRERWGLVVAPVQPGSVWIVASSVGEVRAAAALQRALTSPCLVTADTDTGAVQARAMVPVAGRKPIDHPWTLAPLWAEARPSAVVWVEGAWWPAVDRMAQRAGVATVRVGARPSRSTELRLTMGLRESLVLTRDRADLSWFLDRGVPAEHGGELKLDAPVGPNPLTWAGSFAVAGSTREGDEAAVLAARGGTQWLIAPRHLDRLDRVVPLLQGLRWVLRSDLLDGVVPAEIDVVLLDSMGELDRCYAGASMAFVGGTFDPAVGGHSPVGAWRAGVPVVSGPEIWAHAEAFARCGSVQSAREGLCDAFVRAVGRAVPAAESGVADRIAAQVEAVVRESPSTSPRPWLKPASWVHRAGRTGWHGAWNLGLRTPVRLGIPVASIGSANARSPGKTATVRWLIEELAARGMRPGVAVRGYRRTGSGLACSWSGVDVGGLGDEGAVFAREGWPVAACADRVAAARALEAHGVDVVVLDDGLQHRHLHRDLDLVVVDGRFPASRGELPMGEGREPSIPERAHGVVVHHQRAFQCDLPTAEAVRAPGPWHRGDTPCQGPVGPVAAFAGIGRPADFFATLDRVARSRALPDHCPVDDAMAHELSAWAAGLPLVCTDKDHVRLPPWLARVSYWRTVRLTVSGAPEAWFQRLTAHGSRLTA